MSTSGLKISTFSYKVLAVILFMAFTALILLNPLSTI